MQLLEGPVGLLGLFCIQVRRFQFPKQEVECSYCKLFVGDPQKLLSYIIHGGFVKLVINCVIEDLIIVTYILYHNNDGA